MSESKTEKLYDLERYFVVAIADVMPNINLIKFQKETYVRTEHGFIAAEEYTPPSNAVVWP